MIAGCGVRNQIAYTRIEGRIDLFYRIDRTTANTTYDTAKSMSGLDKIAGARANVRYAARVVILRRGIAKMGPCSQPCPSLASAVSM